MTRIAYPEIDLINIKTVFLDIDDTLYLYTPCHEYAIDYCAKQFIISQLSNITELEFKKLYKKYRVDVTNRLSPQGICRSRLAAFIEMFEFLNIKDSYNHALYFSKLYWDTLISQIKIEHDALCFIEKIYSLGIKMVAVTDMTTEEQIMKLNHMDVSKYIQYIVTSEIAGAEKPDKKIFEYALNISNSKISNTIMIGDSLLKDGEGARNMGIPFYHVSIINE